MFGELGPGHSVLLWWFRSAVASVLPWYLFKIPDSIEPAGVDCIEDHRWIESTVALKGCHTGFRTWCCRLSRASTHPGQDCWHDGAQGRTGPQHSPGEQAAECPIRVTCQHPRHGWYALMGQYYHQHFPLLAVVACLAEIWQRACLAFAVLMTLFYWPAPSCSDIHPHG